MGDTGDDWKAFREANRQKKLNNKSYSTQYLIDNEIDFKSHNSGSHLVIMHGGLALADFWPSTGKYKVRGTIKYKRGLMNLIKDLGSKL